VADRYWAHSDPDAPDSGRRRTRARVQVPPPVPGHLCPGPHRCEVHPDGPVDNEVDPCTSCPPLTGDPLCRGCVRRLKAALAGWPHLFDELKAALEPGSRPVAATGVRVSGGGDGGAPVPYDLAVDAFMRKAVTVLESAADAVRVAAQLTTVQGSRRDYVRARAAAVVLLAHADTLLRLPARAYARPLSAREVDELTVADDAPEHLVASGEAWVNVDLDGPALATEVMRAYDRGRRLLGKTVGREPQPGLPCPVCYHETLIRWHGKDTIECSTPRCTFVTTQEDLDRWRTWLVAQQEATS
jgi:hypothetical protein